MAIVLVNGDVTGVVHPAKTWGALLEILDREQALKGEVVTAVRLNGVDEPAFRAHDLAGAALPADVEVAIETARPEALIGAALEEADTVARNIVAAAQELAVAYRRQDLAMANRGLSGVADSLGSLIVATSAVAQGAAVDLTVVGDGREPAVAMIEALIGETDVLARAQQARDWSRVADVLEHEIAAIVVRWPLVLRNIGRTSPLLNRTAA